MLESNPHAASRVGTLQHIKDQQDQRDQRRLTGRLTKRERRLLQQEIADAAE